MEAWREYLQALPIDDLLEMDGFRDHTSSVLRQVLEEKENGIQHPQLGNLRYEYHGQWKGLQVLDGCSLKLVIAGTADGPDPVCEDEVIFALRNFAALWKDALSLTQDEAHSLY
jgi:hypothetical protein